MSSKLFFSFIFSLLFIGCPDDEPCTTCPPPTKDTIFTVEKELCDGLMPAVSPDGGKIAYTYQGDIYVIDTSGIQTVTWGDSTQWPWVWHTDTISGKPTQLTFGPAMDVLPRWKSDGKTIGFIRSNQGEYNRGLLFTVPVTGGIATQLVLNQFVADSLIHESRRQFGGYIGNPIWEWSPDNKYVAFFSTVGNETYLKAISLKDGIQILNRKVYQQNISSNNRSFVWSSVPNEIAFIAGDTQKQNGRLYLLNLETNEQRIDSSQFSYSFVTHLPQSKLFACGAFDVSSLRVIVTDFNAIQKEYNASTAWGLKCSQDERYFLYEWPGAVGGPFAYEYSQLYIYNIARKKEYRLTNNGDNNLHNYFFEFGKESNTVFFERFNKIYTSSFYF